MRPAPPLVLSLSPNWAGIGYVLFEKPLAPYDWGVKQGRGSEKNRVLMRAVRKLITLYRPSVVVLEDWTDRDAPRCARIETLYGHIVTLCAGMDVSIERVPMRRVQQVFEAHGATTKYEIAQVIAKRIPALSSEVPVRKIWEPESPRQTIFDAAALGLTFFQRTMR
jgi:Holliday junction resolvasome RuvABC endonuclease subunit